ncbi:hemolysin family protein [soil metagenome]
MDPASLEPLPALLAFGDLSLPGLVSRLIALCALLGLSAFFSGSEVALFSLGSADREGLLKARSAQSRRVLALLESPRHLLVLILTLNNLVNIAAAIISAGVLLELGRAMGWPPLVSLAINVVALTFILLVLCEIAPKLLASRRPTEFALRAAAPLTVLAKLMGPLTTVLAGGMGALQQYLRPGTSMLSSEDLKTMADVVDQQGTLEEGERALIHAVVEFGETSVREIMTSRVDIVALSESASFEDALSLIRTTGKSRYPVFRDHLDHILGVVHAKDLLAFLSNGTETKLPPVWSEIARPIRFVPQTKPLDAMLADFRSSGQHIAIVVDEYGGTAGLVTLEDLLEEIVGEIRDEHDTQEVALFKQLAPNTYRVDAKIDLDELAEALDIELATEEYDFETLGGLVYHLAGEIPVRGSQVEHGGMRLTVDRVHNHRIKKVIVQTVAVESAEDSTQD